MTDEEFLNVLRHNILDVAANLRPDNIEACRQALRSISLGLMPESEIHKLAGCKLTGIRK